MLRGLFLILIGGFLVYALTNGVQLGALDPRGVGTRLEGRSVLRDAEQIQARFRAGGPLDESYMIFGGDAQRRRNSLAHGMVAGLPIRDARLIAASHPDFHLCKSPGAAQAQRLVEDLSVVAADRAARSTLAQAVALFEERLRAGGERTCIQLRGARLELDSVKLKQTGADITAEVAPGFARANFVLAQDVRVQDCRVLLR